MSKIYIKIDKRPKNIKQLLEIFYRANKGTSYSHYALPTYFDKECTKEQCRAGAYRSFDDVYLLCKTYFSIVSPKRVIHEMLNLKIMRDNQRFKIRMQYCGGMMKIRFVIVIDNYHQTYNDIINRTYGNSKWSWRELLSMLDINSQEDLENYREQYSIT